MYMMQGIPFRENSVLQTEPILDEYDFVVIGSGPGGSTVANRLSENPDWNILLLEMGPENNIYSDIPLLNPATLLGKFSNSYRSERMENVCFAAQDERCVWPAGEVLGGGTTINNMIYTRSHPSDFDEWAAEGNSGWAFNEVLPYFLKLEKMSIKSLASSKYHSTSGNVNIEYPYFTKLANRWLRAGTELGYDIIDYNSPGFQEGFSKTQVTMKQGRRENAASAYLLPVKSRKNLHIVKNTPATRILINPKSKMAYGINFEKKGYLRKVLARKEVILSAGALNSPKLLMLSGIGRNDHLNELEINVIQDLPVGDNLQEHIGTPFVNFFINSSESIQLNNVIMNSAAHFIQWISGNKGMLSINGVEGLGFVKSPFSTNKPDIELMFTPLTPGTDGGTLFWKTFSMQQDIYKKMWGGYEYREGFAIIPWNMYPKSRGFIRLRSKLFKDPPIIQGNFFKNPTDIKVIISGIREALRIANSKAFQEIGATQHTGLLEYCKQHVFNSDSYWECVIRALPMQIHHQSGTCKMGPDPKSSVVDARLRVHGIRGLRVVDASIMPTLVGMHPQAAVYMIGEKASDLIKEDWKIL